ncbi:MAG TPA: NAD(P)H-hydrate epimerase [Candidatus Omnitrophota bacterium]|nr:NAD(P)H-hydrate epimerase [Candidatus Omnitrophota bacterium]HPW64596.1 NAD(P)H-hydrate epimerase [Candidatus Omnitrophota bacterium]HQB94600.1 NAD(P)H-hydrate epimerase [Candidatus Omnitrophota bacterium]
MRPVTSARMREIDRISSEKFGIPGRTLMENAGRALARIIYLDPTCRKVLIICGKGNNAGDGLAAARYLLERDIEVSILLIDPPSVFSPEALLQYNLLKGSRAAFYRLRDHDAESIMAAILPESQVVLDAIFGFGFRGRISGLHERVVRAINASGKTVYSADLPSGLNADDGTVAGTSVKATVTVTFGLPKAGLFLAEGPALAGRVEVVDIGHPPELLAPYRD